MRCARLPLILSMFAAVAACGKEAERTQEAEPTQQSASAADQTADPQAAYLEEYASRPDVVKTDSGLLYRVIEEGSGESPDLGEMVRVHYRGSFIDGTEFDSSYARGEPAEFPSDGLIKGWQEALTLMQEGAKWELVIPSDLAYGPQGRGPIPGGATLVFTVELLEVLGEG